MRVTPSGVSAASSSRRAWVAVAGRLAGSLSRSRPTTASTSGPTSGRRTEGGVGVSLTCRYSNATGVSALNGGAPVSISVRTQPRAYRSDCGPAGRPDACSGETYAAVPTTVMVCVSAPDPSARAMPKSRTRVRPSSAMRMLPGVMSRWTTPARCAASNASQTSAAMPTQRATGSGPSALRTSRRVRPRTSSMTMNAVWPSTPASKIVTSPGCGSAATCRASRVKRARKTGSVAYCSRRTFTATSRSKTRSRAA